MSMDKLNEAIAKAKSGDKVTAGKMLSEYVQENPSSETAWLWLSFCVTPVKQKRLCLNKVLSINSNNENARKALAKLDAPPPSTPSFAEFSGNQPPSTPVSQPTQSFQKEKPKINQSASPQQPAQPDNLLKKFLNEEQDPAQVQQVFAKVRQILTRGEEILYIAVQKGLVNFSPASVVLTNKRFIIYRPTFLGGANFQDYIWRDLHDARLTEGIINSTIKFQTINAQLLTVGDLPKAQARKLYAFAQEMEEKVLEERRIRGMEERRAGAGGIVLQGGLPTAPTSAPVHQEDDSMQKLKKLKDMLDAGFITQQEYETKKTDILSRF